MEKLECQEAGAPKRRPCDLRVAESMARHVLEQAWLALYVQFGVRLAVRSRQCAFEEARDEAQGELILFISFRFELGQWEA